MEVYSWESHWTSCPVVGLVDWSTGQRPGSFIVVSCDFTKGKVAPNMIPLWAMLRINPGIIDLSCWGFIVAIPQTPKPTATKMFNIVPENLGPSCNLLPSLKDSLKPSAIRKSWGTTSQNPDPWKISGTNPWKYQDVVPQPTLVQLGPIYRWFFHMFPMNPWTFPQYPTAPGRQCSGGEPTGACVCFIVFQGNERENEVQVGLSMLHWSIKSWTRRKFVFAIHVLLYFRIQLLDAEFVTCSSSNILIWAVFKSSYWLMILGLIYLIYYIGLSQCMIWVSCSSWNDRCSWCQLSDFVSGATRSNINPNPQKELNPNCFCVSLAWVECSSLIVVVLHGQILWMVRFRFTVIFSIQNQGFKPPLLIPPI